MNFDFVNNHINNHVGLYPLIGWKIGKETSFLAEGYSADTGLCIEWARQMGKNSRERATLQQH